jgi:hypothetical protein
VAPGVVVFVFPMIRLLAQNNEYFDARYTAGRYVFGAAAVLWLVGFVAWRTAGGRAGRLVLCAYVLLTPAWILYGALQGEERPVVGAVVMVALAVGAVVLARRPADRVVRDVGLFAAIVLAGSGALTAVELVKADDPAAASSSAAATPAGTPERALPNVYHLVFDEFQTDQFERVLDDDTRRALAGFTHYPDAITPFGRTQMAMASVLGRDDYDFDRPPIDYAREAVSDRSYLRVLERAGYRTEGYVEHASMYVYTSPVQELHRHADVITGGDRREDYAGLATSLWVYSHLPGSVSSRLIPDRHYDQLSAQALLPDDTAPVSVDSFREMLRRERDLPATGRYTLVHLLLPHFPNVMSADCRYRPGERTGTLEQSSCAVALIEELVAELARLDRLDSSIVIAHGDHGAQYAVRDGRLVNVQPEGLFSDAYSTARSRALLLVKPAGPAASGRLRVSDLPAMITDIMPTVLDSVGLPHRSTTSRASLLDEDAFPDRPERAYHFYDKHPKRLVDGPIHRFVVSDGVATEDREIDVPT